MQTQKKGEVRVKLRRPSVEVVENGSTDVSEEDCKRFRRLGTMNNVSPFKRNF